MNKENEHEVNNTNTASKGDQKLQAVLDIKKTAVMKVHVAATNLSPIAATEYAHQRNNADRKRETSTKTPTKAWMGNIHKSSPLARIEDVVHSRPIKKRIIVYDDEGDAVPHMFPTNIGLASRGPTLPLKKRSTRKLPTQMSSIPEPKNGKEYTKYEAITILSKLSGRTRNETMKKWIKNKRIPVTCQAIYLHLRKVQDGGSIGKPVR
jgi:hypothetical protein